LPEPLRAGEYVLEASCGIGAQTVELARRSPAASFTCIDRSDASLQRPRATVGEACSMQDSSKAASRQLMPGCGVA
jgi:trans-aconitate methyltransferase